jgi:aspartate racemase
VKKIGLVGGLSWVSTAEYYRLLNQFVRERLGGYHSARILLDSLDEHAFLTAQAADPSETRCEHMITDSVRRLLQGGSEVIALCANGIHRFAPAIRQQCGVSTIHIAEATAHAIEQEQLTHVGLLGVMKTMEGTLYHHILAQKQISVSIPDPVDRAYIHETIMAELVFGTFAERTRHAFTDICAKLHHQGAQGIILGCTEIPLLMKGIDDLPFPLFSTTDIHCRAIVEAALL